MSQTKRGFGTGKGRTKGTGNKITSDVQHLIAKIIAGSFDELSLKVLAVDNPKLYNDLMNSPTVQRVFARKRVSTKRIKGKRPKLKMPKSQEEVDHTLATIQQVKQQKKLDSMTDAEVVKQHLLADGMTEASIPFFLRFVGPVAIANRASELRYKALTPEQKREQAANIYIDLKHRVAASERKKDLN